MSQSQAQYLHVPLYFDKFNYPYWKSPMTAFFKSMDVWTIVEKGYVCPYKAVTEWTTTEKNTHILNDKRMNAIHGTFAK